MRIDDVFHRLGFGLKTRAETWQLLADFTATGMELGLALDTAALIYRDRGKGSVAHILREIRKGLASGGGMTPALRRFTPESDRLMFSGEGTVEPHAMFGAVARIARAQLAMRRAIRQALTGPSLALAALLGLYYLLGARMFPAFAEIVDPAQWPFYAKAISNAATLVANNILWIVPSAVGLGALALVSTRHWTGFGRAFADRVPPWSLTRMQTGVLFLMLLVESGRQGRNLNTAFLFDIATRSGPYAASRIRAIARRCGNDPSGIGAAANRTGYRWPSPILNTALAAYSRQDNWLQNFSRYLDRWMEDMDEQAKASAAAANYILLALVALSLGGSLATVFGLIQSAGTGL